MDIPVKDEDSLSYVIRYGVTRNLGEFEARRDVVFQRDDEVLVRSDRGVEFGIVLCAASPATHEYLGPESTTGKIMRRTTPQDQKTMEEIRLQEQAEFRDCQDLIKQLKLQMELVDVERLFGGERVVFYYLAEKRVDFRELVKLLAKQLRTRIEMRQIGVRDEAKLLADYGDCGKPVCCGTHLREMPPVSMKMAKLQKATLDPNKISGRCGRLKCCLRYEYDVYDEYRRELPNVGSTVITARGQGRVIAQEILARKLMVSYEGGRHILTDFQEVLTVVKSKGKRNEEVSRDDVDQTDQ